MIHKKKRLLISVNESRKIMGKSAELLTNEEIIALVEQSELLARFVIQQYLVRKTEMIK